MCWIIVILIVTLISFVLECILSRNKRKWPGLIIPLVYFVLASVFLAYNLIDAFFTINGYGSFLAEYGSIGFFALLIKICVVYSPVIIQMILYFVCRHLYKKKNDPFHHNKEFKKMIADDLD